MGTLRIRGEELEIIQKRGMTMCDLVVTDPFPQGADPAGRTQTKSSEGQ